MLHLPLKPRHSAVILILTWGTESDCHSGTFVASGLVVVGRRLYLARFDPPVSAEIAMGRLATEQPEQATEQPEQVITVKC